MKKVNRLKVDFPGNARSTNSRMEHSPTLVWGLIARIHEVLGGTPQNHYHPGFCVPWRRRGYLWIEDDEERPNRV